MNDPQQSSSEQINKPIGDPGPKPINVESHNDPKK